jgi:hypothetical protein
MPCALVASGVMRATSSSMAAHCVKVRPRISTQEPTPTHRVGTWNHGEMNEETLSLNSPRLASNRQVSIVLC